MRILCLLWSSGAIGAFFTMSAMVQGLYRERLGGGRGAEVCTRHTTQPRAVRSQGRICDPCNPSLG
jgi:hypothetical protein